MYSLTEQQLEFIAKDISARGIKLENLHGDILDHVCCIVEEEYTGEESFEVFYERTISRFYKTELKEIEEETILHLKFKNYYVMKKMMIYSGAFSVAAFVSGSFFKLMHWPGAGILLVMAIFSAALIFLPLVFIMKSRQEATLRDKFVLASGSLTMILFCLGVLFRIQHWPGALILWFSAIAISFLVFIPLYFFNGIKKPESKINTIVFTVLMVLATGIQFSLINMNPAARQSQLRMYGYLQNEEIINRMMNSHTYKTKATTNDLINNCEQIKKLIIQNAIGQTEIPADFEAKNIIIDEGNLGNAFANGNAGSNLVLQLRKDIEKFNSNVDVTKRIPVTNFVFDVPAEKLYSYSAALVLNSVSQIEMYALLAE